MSDTVHVLDHGYVKLLNVAGPSGPADDTDPANAARMSFDQANSGRTREQDLKLCDYLMRNRHTTPFEMVQVWMEMKLPIFVARQFVRHRTVSLNEISGRYVELPAEWYIPEPETVGTRSDNKKQGRDAASSEQDVERAMWFCEALDFSCAADYDSYLWALDQGIPPEEARMFLHTNHYTKWLWRQDLHNLLHFLALRDHAHAQWESQQYAKAIDQLMRSVLPDLMNLYDAYRK